MGTPPDMLTLLHRYRDPLHALESERTEQGLLRRMILAQEDPMALTRIKKQYDAVHILPRLIPGLGRTEYRTLLELSHTNETKQCVMSHHDTYQVHALLTPHRTKRELKVLYNIAYTEDAKQAVAVHHYTLFVYPQARICVKEKDLACLYGIETLGTWGRDQMALLYDEHHVTPKLWCCRQVEEYRRLIRRAQSKETIQKIGAQFDAQYILPKIDLAQTEADFEELLQVAWTDSTRELINTAHDHHLVLHTLNRVRTHQELVQRYIGARTVVAKEQVALRHKKVLARAHLQPLSQDLYMLFCEPPPYLIDALRSLALLLLESGRQW